jgi:hypothetical protein
MRAPFNCLSLLAILSIAMTGCASTPQTRLELRGDPHGPAVYEFRQTLWRQRPDGIEIIAYGTTSFYNSPISADYQPRWPTSGFVTFRMHGEPLAGGCLAITILGPAKELGPGDDEVLSGFADSVNAAAPDERTPGIDLHDVPMRSRNHPDMRLTLSGQIVATRAGEAEFDRELRRFNQELSYRHPPPPPLPPPP